MLHAELIGPGRRVRTVIAPNWSVDKAKSVLFGLLNASLPTCLHPADFHLCLDKDRVLSVEYQNFGRSPHVADQLARADSTSLVTLLLLSRSTNLVAFTPDDAVDPAQPQRARASSDLVELARPATPKKSSPAKKKSSSSSPPPPPPQAAALQQGVERLRTLLDNEARRAAQRGGQADASLLNGVEAFTYCAQALQQLLLDPHAFVGDQRSDYLVPDAVLQLRQSTKPPADVKPSKSSTDVKPTKSSTDAKPSKSSTDVKPTTKPTTDVKPTDVKPTTKPTTDVKPTTKPTTDVKPTDVKPTTDVKLTDVKPTTDTKPNKSSTDVKPTKATTDLKAKVASKSKASKATAAKLVSVRGQFIHTEVEDVSDSESDLSSSSSSSSDSDSDSDSDAASSSSSSSKKDVIDFAELPALEHKLGEGSFANVYLTTYRGEAVAVKLLKWDETMDSEERSWFVDDFHREVSTLKQISHPNILRFVGACASAPHYCIVTEFVEGGNLRDRLRGKHAGALPWVQRLKFAYDVAQAVNYLHTREPKIVHRDIKAENVLLTRNDEVRLADFGLVKMKKGAQLRREGSFIVMDELLEQRQATEQGRRQIVRTMTRKRLPRWESYCEFNDMTSMCGTPSFLAPEIYLMQPFNEKVDVFAFGVLLWELLTRQAPHPGLGFTQIGEKITQTQRLDVPAYCPPRYRKLIESTWEQRPTRRPPMAEVMLAIEVCALAEHDSAIPN